MSSDISKERREYLKRLSADKRKTYAVRIAILVLFIAFWEISASLEWIDPFIMSQPSRIVNSIVNLSKNGELFMHLGVSTAETVIGFVSGTILGTVIAILLWWSKFFSKALEPYPCHIKCTSKNSPWPCLYRVGWRGNGRNHYYDNRYIPHCNHIGGAERISVNRSRKD